MLKLYKEVFVKFRDDFIAARKLRPLRENLYLICIGLALVVLIVVIIMYFVNKYVPPHLL